MMTPTQKHGYSLIMRIIFMGTPDFACPALEALHSAGHELVAVYSQPPRPANRGKALTPSPVQRLAEQYRLTIKTPLNFKNDIEVTDFTAFNADVAIVAAYGLILPQAILSAPRHGCLNIHASLLPRWRGAAPIQRAILAGDSETGVTIMQMERGLDTGAMLLKQTLIIADKTAGQLTKELSKIGADLIVSALARLDHIIAEPQPTIGVTYASKIDKAEARLNFSQSAAQVERQIRAFNPVPGAFFEYAGERIRILAADIVDQLGPPGTIVDEQLTIACGGGAIRPTLIQRAGKSAMPTAALLHGFAIPVGSQL
jgi:methionyl-tRNA formyltransferase